jgi:hypothetical protein
MRRRGFRCDVEVEDSVVMRRRGCCSAEKKAVLL